MGLERRAFCLRKRVEKLTADAGCAVYLPSLSARTVTYKGMLTTDQLPAFFPEPPGRWVMVRQTLRQGQEQMPYPFMLKDQPFIPASKPVLRERLKGIAKSSAKRCAS